jgi:membrane protein EpsK
MFQLKKNFLFNIISLFVNIALGFYYTPYLLNSLGIIAYGIVPLAIIISQYISILTTSLTGSLTRFYAVEIQKRDFEKASYYLSSSFFVILVIIISTIPLFSIIIVNIDKIFNIPYVFLYSAKLLFIFTLLSFYFSLISSFLNIFLYANNRLDLLNLVNIIRTVFKVIFNILFFEFISKDIKFIGVSNLISEVIVFFFSIYLFRNFNLNEVKIKFKYFNKIALISIGTMTIWVIIHQIGDLAIYKINLFFVNRFWSTTESGVLGAITDFGYYLLIIISVLGSLFGPIILIAFSKNDHEKVKKIVLNNSLIIGLISTILVSLIICFSEEFLSLWLGKNYVKYSDWLILKLIDLPFYASAGMFSFVYRTWNKVIIPALITLTIGAINVLGIYIVCKISNNEINYINYILIFSAFCSFLQTYVLGGIMVKHIYVDLSSKLLLMIPVKIMILFSIIFVTSKLIKNFFIIEKWYQLFFCFSIIGFFVLIISFYFILSENSKKYIESELFRKDNN